MGTYIVIRAEPRCSPHHISELPQVRQSISIVLLRRFVEEDTSDGQIGYGTVGRPSSIGFNIFAHQGNISSGICGSNVAQEPNIII